MTDFSKPVEAIHVDVPAEHAGQRIDAYLPRRFNWRSRNYFFGLLKEGAIRVNDREVKKSYRVRAGDRITVDLPESYKVQFDYDAIPLDIVYEDEAMLAVDKTGNMAVQPTGRYIHENLLYRLRHHYRADDGGTTCDPCIVHRLDRETSGLIVFAKSPDVARDLAGQFLRKQTDKVYLAIVHGHPPPSGTINAPLLATEDRHVVVDPAGKFALTHYRVRSHHGPFALVELHLMTGRQHQLRVHLSSIGHPIVADEFYGPPQDREDASLPDRHMLHAAQLRITSPAQGGRALLLQAELPADMRALLAKQP